MNVGEYQYYFTYLTNLKIFLKEEREELNSSERMKIGGEIHRLTKLLNVK